MDKGTLHSATFSVRGFVVCLALFPILAGLLFVLGAYPGASSARPFEAALEVEADSTSFITADVIRERRLQRAREEVLWLARGIYSETKQPHEQELIAWVMRNRVETAYRGKTTYKQVVLDPYQFSAFNPGSPRKRLYSRLDTSDTVRGWPRAVQIARRVMEAPASHRPFPVETRHFYSERSMPDSLAPVWALEKQPVVLTHARVEPRRFRFYSGIL